MFEGCLYVPELAYSLLSVSKASTVGAKVMFEGKKCKILADDGELIAEATKTGGLYYLDCKPAEDVKSNSANSAQRWIQRSGCGTVDLDTVAWRQ